MQTSRMWIIVGAILGLLGVVAGALGAHALRGILETDALATFQTAVRFQMYHAIVLLVVGLLAGRWRPGFINLACALFTAGVLLFSGSLYMLAITGIGVFGAVTPLGGVGLIAGWGTLIIGAFRHKD